MPKSVTLGKRRQSQTHGVGQSYNLKAEVNLKAAFQKAGQLSPRHFGITISGDTITAIYSKIQAAEGSGIEDDRFCEVQYVMQQPHLRYSCCTCPDAVQQNLCKHQAAVLMLLYPSQEARKTMLKMLGTRLGMEGGCHPERAEPLRCLHEALLPLAVPSLREAHAACNIPHEHEQPTGAAASLIQESRRSPPCCEPPALQKCSNEATAQRRIPGKIAAATEKMLAEYGELLQRVNQQLDPEKQDAMLQQCAAMLTHTKRTLLATEVSICSETLCQHPGLSSKRRLDAMEASRLRKQPKPVAAAPAFQLPPRTAREGTSFAWKGAKGSAEMIEQLYGKYTANSEKSPATSITATRAPLADISDVQLT
jgi:hypothetical protein